MGEKEEEDRNDWREAEEEEKREEEKEEEMKREGRGKEKECDKKCCLLHHLHSCIVQKPHPTSF
jgi:hypothetical protein